MMNIPIYIYIYKNAANGIESPESNRAESESLESDRAATRIESNRSNPTVPTIESNRTRIESNRSMYQMNRTKRMYPNRTHIFFLAR